ncbi:MAG: hypothetical protein SGPRY_004933 [Prymnesium sp.]
MFDKRRIPAKEFAVARWRHHLQCQDFLLNEHAVQYREARPLGLEVAFHHCMRPLPMAKSMQVEFYPTWAEKGFTLKLVRSAKHFHFPDKIYADPQLVKERYDARVTHAKSWQDDHEEALRLRYLANPPSSTINQCDDKCGSYWQQLPVPMSGRELKANAKIQYNFCTQANVVCGEKGIIWFTCVPRNIATDGVFEEVLWFRFKAEHSHTEICDRLFSITKAIFESGSCTRVAREEDFSQLI